MEYLPIQLTFIVKQDYLLIAPIDAGVEEVWM
jgi:hypothetical protein